MLLKPSPKTLRAIHVLAGVAVPTFIIISLLFTAYGGSFVGTGLETFAVDIFSRLLLIVVLGIFFLPVLLVMNESWEIVDGTLIHRWAYERKVYSISEIVSFGPPFFFDRFKATFRGNRQRHLVVGDRKVDRMMFPYLYDRVELDAFLNELKRLNPQMRLEPTLAKKFWL